MLSYFPNDFKQIFLCESGFVWRTNPAFLPVAGCDGAKLGRNYHHIITMILTGEKRRGTAGGVPCSQSPCPLNPDRSNPGQGRHTGLPLQGL
ncbi:MAG: hypothetical protein B6245_06430 [Desulfobacteraceae bacterium 4572_88]|nr:MAG: hypothetical protein B6245_06430 [Desulfobacteraceae bacterium 4572_88]